ncbi:MAG: hypothetical protein V4658_01010 [Bacteroidota bacterium]
MNNAYKFFFFCSFLLVLASCGNKEDDQTKDIFEQGRIDPNLIPNKVGYVPLYPYFTNLLHPVDVYVGYDEMVYVVDDRGLNVLDQTGKMVKTIFIPDYFILNFLPVLQIFLNRNLRRINQSHFYRLFKINHY